MKYHYLQNMLKTHLKLIFRKITKTIAHRKSSYQQD